MRNTGKFAGMSACERAAFLAINPTKVDLFLVEKVRRYCSLHNRRLLRVSKLHFGAENISMLQQMFKILSYHVSSRNQTSGALIDSLNWLGSAIGCKHAFNFFSDDEKLPLKKMLGIPIFDTSVLNNAKAFSAKPVEITIFAPTDFSAVAILTCMLANSSPNVLIKRVVVRRIGRTRLLQELRRDGLWRLMKKFFNKAILKSDENHVCGVLTVNTLKKSIDNFPVSLKSFCKSHCVQYDVVNEFDQIDISDCTSTVIFCGGGKVSAAALRKFPNGIINCHMGILPQYRGMDVVEAPLLSLDYTNIGLTCHFMNQNIDDGPIIKQYRVNPCFFESLAELRNAIGVLMPFCLIDSLSGKHSTVENNGGTMHYYISEHARYQLDHLFKRSNLIRSQEIIGMTERSKRKVLEKCLARLSSATP